jgi:hypothetical protein
MKGPSYWSNIIAARHQYLLGWVVVRFPHIFANEIHLLRSNQVADSRYVVEHVLDASIQDSLFFHTSYQHSQDMMVLW